MLASCQTAKSYDSLSPTDIRIVCKILKETRVRFDMEEFAHLKEVTKEVAKRNPSIQKELGGCK